MTGCETHRLNDEAPVDVPLSFGEELLWTAEQPGRVGTPFFECPSTVSVAAHIEQPLNVKALAASYNDIIRRHDVLRSRFIEGDGRPTRTFMPFSPVALETVDLRLAPNGERSATLTRVLELHAKAAFDLARRSPVRASLVILDAEHHVFVFTAHHIVFDGWSRRVLARELERFYGAYSTHRLPDAKPLAAGYHSYVSWQRDVLEGSTYGALLDYWTDKLHASPDLRVPRDRAGSDPASVRADTRLFTLRAENVGRLRLVSRAYGATLAMTLLAVFTLLLSRSTGIDDVVVGMPIADRRRVEFEDLIGLFTNVLVVRTSVPARATYGDLITRVRDGLRQAYLHQDVPYGHLVRVLERPTPLYRVVFNYTPELNGLSLRLPGLDVEPIALAGERKATVDLSLHIQELNSGLTCRFVYKADWFSAEFIGELARQFQGLVAAVAKAPAASVETFAAG